MNFLYLAEFHHKLYLSPLFLFLAGTLSKQGTYVFVKSNSNLRALDDFFLSQYFMNLQHFKLTATIQMSITSDSINKILNFIKVEFKFFIIPIS